MRLTVLPSKRCDQRGVTLVEVLISLVILLIVFMGLIQASILSISQNRNNEIRDEASRITSEYMSVAKSAVIAPETTPIDTLAKTGGLQKICSAAVPQPPCNATTGNCQATTVTVNRSIRNLTQPYNVITGGCFTDASYSNAQVTITVNYIFPDQPAGDLADANKRQTTSANTIMKRL